MNKEKQIEKDELFGILSNTINGANFDDLSEAVYKISDVAGYRKQSEGEWIRYPHGSGIYCSLCKHKRRYRDINDAFCSNCGASMKGGAE